MGVVQNKKKNFLSGIYYKNIFPGRMDYFSGGYQLFSQDINFEKVQ